MRRSVIVPLALRDAVRAATGDKLKSGAYEYVLEGACYCRRARGEGMWVAASSDRLKEGDLWLPMAERPGEDMHPGSPAWATVREYDPSLTPEDYGEVNPYTGIGQVRKYIPPPSRNGSLVFIEDPGGTRIRCLDHDDADDRTWIITSPPHDDDAADFEDYLREVYPELFEGGYSGRSERGTRAEAEAFLRELLADGEMWAKDVEQAASARGIKETTLLRASRYVVAKHRGEGNKSIWGLREQKIERTSSPSPYAHARCTAENEDKVDEVRQVLGAEPKTTRSSGDEDKVLAESTRSSGPKTKSKTESILALQAVPGQLRQLGLPSHRDIAREADDVVGLRQTHKTPWRSAADILADLASGES